MLSAQLANHFRQVFFGENWTSVNLKKTLETVSWQQAIAKFQTCNSILALTYHINYSAKKFLWKTEKIIPSKEANIKKIARVIRQEHPTRKENNLEAAEKKPTTRAVLVPTIVIAMKEQVRRILLCNTKQNAVNFAA
ncbi:MAG: hypothetical protein C4308_02105 [Chitinophagaceae bacterium]